MLDPGAVARGVFGLLRAGGRFVGEMGGAGNLATLRRGIREELTERGYSVPAEGPQWYASPHALKTVYGDAGFTDIEAMLTDRPTLLPTGIRGWVKTFRSGWFDVVGVAPDDREEIAAAVEARLAPELRREDGSFYADYVRIRFKMIKPG
jgi:hypothetical protein